MEYLEITITIKPEDEDTVTALLASVNIDDIQIKDQGIRTDFVPNDESVVVDWSDIDLPVDETQIIFYQDTKEVSVTASDVEKLLSGAGTDVSVQSQTIEAVDWSNNWKHYYHPLRLSRDIVIKPTWEELPEEFMGSKVIEMDPQMAFGAGTHETTRLSVQALNDLDLAGKTVLDVGTGSGVLAIAASKLGAGELYASDIDEKSVSIAKNNMINNSVTNVNVFASDLLKDVPAMKFDVILANLLLPIHQRMIPDIAQFMNDDTPLIMSGITEAQREQVVKLLSDNHFNIIKEYSENDWLALTVKQDI